jgi:hypothetical protein
LWIGAEWCGMSKMRSKEEEDEKKKEKSLF